MILYVLENNDIHRALEEGVHDFHIAYLFLWNGSLHGIGGEKVFGTFEVGLQFGLGELEVGVNGILQKGNRILMSLTHEL